MSKPRVMTQQWRDLLFLHWAYEPELVAATLPEGLEPDCFEGKAWVAIVPFFMARVRPVWAPPLPWLSWFLELNVRTYVRCGDRTGVWFYSLDCNQPVAVEIAKAAFGLPYRHAAMRARRGLYVDYRCQRRGRCDSWHYRYRGNGEPTPASPDSLEAYLVERYHLISPRRSGGFYTGRVAHAPYQLETASLLEFDPTPLATANLPLPDRPADHVRYARHLDVEIYPVDPLPKC